LSAQTADLLIAEARAADPPAPASGAPLVQPVEVATIPAPGRSHAAQQKAGATLDQQVLTELDAFFAEEGSYV
jgi:hypothetical protein